MTVAVPLVDLKWQHRAIAAELGPALAQVIESGRFILGPEVAEFEAEFAAFVDVRHCVGVASGTDALELALSAIKVPRGTEVLIPANSFIATAAAALRAGLVPRLVDCDPVYLLMDPDRLEDAVGPESRVVLPVHLFGQIAPMEDIERVAQRNDLRIVEDGAQSHGALARGRPMGAWSAAAATSFYPGKNLGAYGDAGAIVTNDDDLAGLLRLLRDHGSSGKYRHVIVGANSRLDAIQAVVLRVKLRHLGEWNRLRSVAAERYTDMLSRTERVRLPQVRSGNVDAWHLYVVRVPERDRVFNRMREQGVECGIHYPVPIHLQPAMAGLGYRRGDFPVAEAAAEEMLSLPIYPGITRDQQDQVVYCLLRSLDS